MTCADHKVTEVDAVRLAIYAEVANRGATGRFDAWLCGYVPPLPGELARAFPEPARYASCCGRASPSPSGEELEFAANVAEIRAGWAFLFRGTLELARHRKRIVIRMPSHGNCRVLWETVEFLHPGSPAARAVRGMPQKSRRKHINLLLQANAVLDFDDFAESSLHWLVEPGCGLESFPLELWKYPPLPEGFPYDMDLEFPE